MYRNDCITLPPTEDNHFFSDSSLSSNKNFCSGLRWLISPLLNRAVGDIFFSEFHPELLVKHYLLPLRDCLLHSLLSSSYKKLISQSYKEVISYNFLTNRRGEGLGN